MAGKEMASDKIMEAAKMKPLLALSKREPVQAAVALTAEGDGVVLLDKRLKPKKVLAQLKALAGKEKIKLETSTFRFGKAEVDTDYDPGMVRFFVNKEAPGKMRIALVTVFKQIAYSKVEFNVDASFEEEPDEETEGQEAAPASAPASAPATAAAPPPPPPPPPLDPKALTAALTQLMQAIPTAAAGDGGVQKSLVALAATAQGSLKAANLPEASKGIAALRSALAAAMEQAKQKAGAAPARPAGEPKPAAGDGSFVKMQKSRLIWDSARKKVNSEINGLKEATRTAFADDFEESKALDALDQLDDILGKLDDRLLDTLDDLLQETDQAKHAELLDDAKELIDEYLAYTESNELVKKLDGDTPLGIKLSIASTLNTTLKALQASLR